MSGARDIIDRSSTSSDGRGRRLLVSTAGATVLLCLANPDLGAGQWGLFTILRVDYPGVFGFGLVAVLAYAHWQYELFHPDLSQRELDLAFAELFSPDNLRIAGAHVEPPKIGTTSNRFTRTARAVFDAIGVARSRGNPLRFVSEHFAAGPSQAELVFDSSAPEWARAQYEKATRSVGPEALVSLFAAANWPSQGTRSMSFATLLENGGRRYELRLVGDPAHWRPLLARGKVPGERLIRFQKVWLRFEFSEPRASASQSPSQLGALTGEFPDAPVVGEVQRVLRRALSDVRARNGQWFSVHLPRKLVWLAWACVACELGAFVWAWSVAGVYPAERSVVIDTLSAVT